jgi:hypothetical protein
MGIARAGVPPGVTKEHLMRYVLMFASALCAAALSSVSAQSLTFKPAGHSGPPVYTGSAAKAVVGTWIATYDGGVHSAVAQWQKGGTSSQIVDFSAKTGNALLGDWTAVDDQNVSVFLTGWTYDDKGVNLTGYFNKSETDTVSKNGYNGNFEVTFYDLAGNVVFDHSGTLTAVRISAQ